MQYSCCTRTCIMGLVIQLECTKQRCPTLIKGNEVIGDLVRSRLSVPCYFKLVLSEYDKMFNVMCALWSSGIQEGELGDWGVRFWGHGE